MNQNTSHKSTVESEWSTQTQDGRTDKEYKKEKYDISQSNNHEPHHFRSDVILGKDGANTNTWTKTEENSKIENCADKNCSKEHCETGCEKTHTSHHTRQEIQTGDQTKVREYCETNCNKEHDYPHKYRQEINKQSENIGNELGNQQGQFDKNSDNYTQKMPTGQDYLRPDKDQLRQDYGNQSGIPHDRLPQSGQQSRQGNEQFRDEQFHENQFKEGDVGQQGYGGKSGYSQQGSTGQKGYSGSINIGTEGHSGSGYSGQSAAHSRQQEGQTGQTYTGQSIPTGQSGIKEDKIPHGPQLHKEEIGFVPKDAKVLYDQGLIDKKGQYVHKNEQELVGDRH